MSVLAREGHGCGLVLEDVGNSQQQLLVVAGGLWETTSEIFDLSTGHWRPGPELEVDLHHAASVQLPVIY